MGAERELQQKVLMQQEEHSLLYWLSARDPGIRAVEHGALPHMKAAVNQTMTTNSSLGYTVAALPCTFVNFTKADTFD